MGSRCWNGSYRNRRGDGKLELCNSVPGFCEGRHEVSETIKWGDFFSGCRRNYLHNIIISKRTLLHELSYAMGILGDNVIPNDHEWIASFRYTSFADLYKTNFKTSSWPPDGELCLLCFRYQRSSNNRPMIQRKLIGQN